MACGLQRFWAVVTKTQGWVPDTPECNAALGGYILGRVSAVRVLPEPRIRDGPPY